MTPDDDLPTGEPDDDGLVPENGSGEDVQSLSDVLEAAWDEAEGETEPSPAAAAGPAGGEDPEPGGETADQAEGVSDSAEGEAGKPVSSALEAIEAPAHWPADQREKFAGLGPDIQHWLLDRVRGMDRAHTQRSQELAPWRDLAQEWNPYFAQLNVEAPQAIRLLLETEHLLRTGTNDQKVATLRRLVDDYGIQAPAQDDEGNFVEPDPRIGQIERQLQEMNGRHQQQQMASHQARIDTANRAIQDFAQARGADGTLAHPYFGEVRNDMTRLAQAERSAGIQPDLASLYERAIWANPTVRSKLLAADNQVKAQKARRAAGQVSGAGVPVRGEQPKGLRDFLATEYDRLSAA